MMTSSSPSENSARVEVEILGSLTDESFDFSLRCPDEIPGTFWPGSVSTRDGEPQAPPLILLQHGGPFHKRHANTDALAQSIVQRTGAAVLLIDGPIHGRRRADQPELMEMLATFRKFWEDDAGIDGLVADWALALDVVLERGWADPDRVAWFGVSMGTAYGIPFCAVDGRIKAAAFGMWGTDWGQADRLISDARLIRAPAIFQIKSDDQFFPVEGQRRLFDELGSPTKCLSILPGGHNLTGPGQLDQLLNFLITALDQREPPTD